MRRVAVALLLGVTVTALVSPSMLGAGPVTAAATSHVEAPVLSPTHMPWLPARLLVIQQRHDVLLVGVDGQVYGRLVGFELAPFTRSQTLQALSDGLFAGELPSETLLLGPLGRSWWLVRGQLVALPSGRLPLPGGAELVVPPASAAGAPDVRLINTRTHDVLATSWLIDRSLVMTPRLVLDLVSRSRWLLKPGLEWLTVDGDTGLPGTCTPAGVVNGKLIAACVTTPRGRILTVDVRLFSFSGSVRREPEARPIILGEADEGVNNVSLSPNGRYVAADLAIECGRQAIVTEIPGGTPRYVDLWNSAHQSTRLQIEGHQATTVLGWSEDGKLIVQAYRLARCGLSIPPGIYAIDPVTLRRTLVYAYSGGDATKPVGALLSGPD